MSIKEEDYTQPAKTYKRITQWKCELCKCITMREEVWPPRMSSHDKYHATVMLEDGYNVPECGSGTKTIVDICPDCFTNKLLPWLASQGATTRSENWEW